MGGNIIPATPRGATLGTLTNPFADIFVASGSINIAGIPGQPNTTLSNVSGALLVSAGNMQLVGSASFLAQTGSFQYISGSMKQVGNYTQVGDYSLTGNKNITGSLYISGSGFINSKRILTDLDSGSFAITGSNTFNGNQIISGSVTLSSGSALNINDGFYVNGNKQFNYGQFFSTGSQLNPVANVSHSMVYETLDFASGFSVVSGSRLTNTNKGVYNLQFSSQFQQTTNVDSNFSIWFRKNGLNVSGSNTEVSIAKNSKGTSELVAAWNYLYQANANDYIEIMWSSPDTGLEILYGGTQTNPNRPTTPSVIVTVTQIA